MYIHLHEFEALLLSDARQFEWQFIEDDRAIMRLVELASQIDSPELIDDGEAPAPSKRIIQEVPEYGYRKATAGPVIAGKIGLQTMRDRCPHFAEWVARLEALAV